MPIIYVIQRDPLGKATRNGEFSFSLLFYEFEAVLGIRPANILQITQRIIVAKFNLLGRCELD